MTERERHPKVPCPYCEHWDSKVEGGGEAAGGYRRYRRCQRCLKRYTTLEKIFPAQISCTPPSTQ